MGTCWSTLYQSVLCAGGCYDRDNIATPQQKIHISVCHTKQKALQHGKEEENASKVHLMLHESRVSSL